MKFKSLFLVAIVSVLSFSSCNNDEIECSLDSINQNTDVGVYSETRGVTSSSEMLRTKFLPVYHWWQKKDRNDNLLLCGPTAYMVATNAVAKYNGIDYTMSKEEQDKIYKVTGKSPTPYNLYNHSVTKYKNYIKCDFARGKNLSHDGANWTTRGKIKDFIEKALSDGKLVVMPARINGYGASNWENDDTKTGNNSGNERENQYITKHGTIGHYFVIYRLDREKDENGYSIGTLYYVDVLEKDASKSKKTVNYLRFLDANAATSKNGNTYSAIWFDSK